MTVFRLVLLSLRHYWRTTAAVLLGVITATAVVGGALVVGDSVRGSLRQMTLVRLGCIDHALSSQRYFREELAAELLAKKPEIAKDFEVAPALVLIGSLEAQSSGATNRVGRVQVYGVDDRLWEWTDHGTVKSPKGREILLNSRVAAQLGLAATSDPDVGKSPEVTLTIELPASIPRDMLLGERDAAARPITFTVRDVLGDRLGVGRFDLNPNQQLPLVAFVPLDTLQESLGLAKAEPSRRNPDGLPARVNSLFVTEHHSDGGPAAERTAKELTAALANCVTLHDIDLRLQKYSDRGYFSLESDRQILEESIAQSAVRTADALRLKKSSGFVYLANELVNEKKKNRLSMYSVVAGVNPDELKEPPFGPFAVSTPTNGRPLAPDEILINDWLATDLDAKAGDHVEIEYHVVGTHGELPKQRHEFVVAGVVDLKDRTVADTGYVPEVKGITDAKTFLDWDQPFDMDLERITDRDEQYWEKYRTTPKAFVSLQTAQELWGSRYGRLTSLRVAVAEGKTLDETAEMFSAALLHSLTTEQTGLIFQPVKFTGIRAASGSNDFSQLFVSFSFFLILSAAILIGLLFRLGIERRGANIGLLSAVGFSPRRVRRIFLGEGFLVVIAGGLLGSLVAVGYAGLMIYGLKTWWNRAIGTRFLDVYVTPTSLVTGFVVSVFVAGGAVWWGMRQLSQLSARDLLSGATEIEQTACDRRRRGRFAEWLALVCVLVSALLLACSVFGLVPSSEAFGGLSWLVVCFFLVGVLLLAAATLFLAGWLDSDRAPAIRGTGAAALARLGLRNAARQRQRSVFSAGLISSATFVIIAVSAGHRNPAAERPEKNSGNGGYLLVAQSARPILYDLNTAAGRKQLNLDDGDSLLNGLHVTSLRVQPGEDASCLNAYQTRTPTILGVPHAMIERGGFKFIGARGDNPWNLLEEPAADNTIPVVGDMNTLQFSLHKGPGDILAVPDSRQRPQMLKIVGMLDGSVFQGVLLMSEANFLKLYPDRAGYEYFLMEAPVDHAGDVSTITHQLSDALETGLRDYGFDAEPVSERLADFLAVQNTYLSTFQTLGGLGLLLGTFGLATVMLRNVLERRAELALLRAVGYRSRHIAWLVLAENGFLLAWGLATGTAAALLAMTPHLLSIGADVPWGGVAAILASVFVAGMAAALLAVVEAVRTPLIAALRSE